MHISAAWATIARWAVTQGAIGVDQMDKPWRGETDQWKVAINGANEERENIPPKGIELQHKEYLRFAVLGPTGGAITGVSEGDLIQHFERASQRALT